MFKYEIGLDLHKKCSVLSVVDSNGKKLSHHRVNNYPEEFDVFFDSFSEPIRVTFEASRNYYWLADYLSEKGIPFIMANPFLNRAIATVHAKNDKYDSTVIAQLTHSNMVAPCYVPPAKYRYLRELSRYRYRLVKHRTMLKNSVHTYLDKYNFKAPYNYVFGHNGIKWIQKQNFPKVIQLLITHQLQLIEIFSEVIDSLYGTIKDRIIKHPDYRILSTVPGIGVVHAATIISEIVDINRFKRVESFIRYAGLAVSTRASADKIHQGHLNKQANKHLRTAFIEAALITIKKDTGLKAFYEYKKEHKGHGKAIVATARKLARSVYFMLLKQQPYRYRNIKAA